ncbi:TPA: bacteriophage CI repressor [Escherichia coli]|uniref:Regulatory protein n=1 Tax=Escherichia coli TaxID=562 RepID=A0AAW7VI19_ECOLX|nr:hypothetical protein [Escherichia coli]EEZ4653198.1 bacteriophage CI repressor [Escherichia coli]EFH9014247.1 hypothetical protein [Escherichia coli]EHI0511107.1 bacteriophage CI repressor [Escherichia coli]EHM8639815.1 hypothetical protein [Escherichia coli]EHY7501719.1 hypothetical protein [Escherichia coli]
MKRETQKEHNGSFAPDSKEPVINRIFKLVDRYRSRNEAAKAWGININTLQNYYKRKDLSPVPRKTLLEKIAQCEGVSLEWLQTGEGKEPEMNIKRTQDGLVPPHSDLDDKILSLIRFLSDSEKEALFQVLARKGIETLLFLLDEDNIRLLQMDRVVKEKILGIQPRTPEEQAFADNEARECDTTHPLRHEQSKSLTTKKQQAR